MPGHASGGLFQRLAVLGGTVRTWSLALEKENPTVKSKAGETELLLAYI